MIYPFIVCHIYHLPAETVIRIAVFVPVISQPGLCGGGSFYLHRKNRREIADKEARHKQEISFLKTVIARAAAWFPYFREMLRIENLCRLVGFSDGQIATLVKGKPLEYAGELYSEEHKRKFTTEKAGFQVLKAPTDGTKLVLAIDRKPITE